MNTVHLEPKSTGFLAEIAEFTNSLIVSPRLFANVSINEPHPDEMVQSFVNEIAEKLNDHPA